MPTFTTTQAGYQMTASLQVVGFDLLIVVTGGDNPHIGDVTTLTKTTAPQTVKFPSHDGRFHKDNFISERLAKQLQPVLVGSCTITAGIHVNQISKAQIAAAAPMTTALGEQIIAWLTAHPIQAAQPEYYRNDERPK
ncbi:amino acid decarboxylase [Lactiplantibacillus mudanjiangensis]|uniref:Amino acid decarboxylase [Lactobacillus sp.] n=1 Tax=Lactiplantibacillus mudanjiangensis TaxID=1296538 RepID=A0A660E3E1_9LACO|nr:amino acid decarboxylase [Lactiplantibacillus mudanjiangensis]VDG21126.1 amino acid decarboxylase [Lactobacillus sp.] [Lactiplantibacillus mudanjiangensis]VDG22938.1 amino acid decarboxylase [Lactobacillus sp.] [Lactiplantibacillus mudanjiangensis]VDG29203.1 amino acid decarboxylase [Lactobacillus sp.] [Lactiplantibacillus mudanjiangensis]VDG31726.1 amino acid decarboxylase [Lactobacillus sp.] [Lactiplantibacillus mudanjiangensis]